jgi:dTDP-4-amino-4,6-dideoxygalactose transaminase
MFRHHHTFIGELINMQVPLLDLKEQYRSLKKEILAVTEAVYESQYFILGERVTALEESIARYCGTSHAVGVSSGSDALIISLMAAGISTGDMVLTTPYSFFATAGAIARLGARPIFADIDPQTFNLSPETLEPVMQRLTVSERKQIKAIIPVHLYGQCADMDPILKFARAHDLVVIEDAAQAIGSEYHQRRAGSMGTFGCFSFFPSKNLGAFGDGGVVTTNSQEIYHQLQILRGHGSKPKYYHKIIGGNFRLDALQAAIVSVKLSHLDNWTQARQDNAMKYRKLFSQAGLDKTIHLPLEKENRHIYNQFVVMVPNKRDALREFLAQVGIGTEVYYPVPLHLQECFRYLGYQPGDFKVAEKAALHSLAIPIYPELSNEQLEYVVDKFKEFYTF